MSLYNFLTHGGVDLQAKMLWKCKIPMKVKVFLWQMLHNKLQSAVELKKSGWKGKSNCSSCGERKGQLIIFSSMLYRTDAMVLHARGV